jgi:hypothetical protein
VREHDGEELGTRGWNEPSRKRWKRERTRRCALEGAKREASRRIAYCGQQQEALMGRYTRLPQRRHPRHSSAAAAQGRMDSLHNGWSV